VLELIEAEPGLGRLEGFLDAPTATGDRVVQGFGFRAQQR
jgi:hypothetical protein